MRKKKIGRPGLDDEIKLSERIAVHVQPSEREQIDAAAKAARKATSAWARETLLAAAR